jgi:hypothetical protein
MFSRPRRQGLFMVRCMSNRGSTCRYFYRTNVLFAGILVLSVSMQLVMRRDYPTAWLLWDDKKILCMPNRRVMDRDFSSAWFVCDTMGALWNVQASVTAGTSRRDRKGRDGGCVASPRHPVGFLGRLHRSSSRCDCSMSMTESAANRPGRSRW